MITAGHASAVGRACRGLTGLVLVVSDTLNPEGFTAQARGVLSAVGALLCMTVGTIAQQRLAGVRLWSSLAVQHSVASCVFVPLALVTGQTAVVPVPAFWAAAAWMIIVVSTGATESGQASMLTLSACTGNLTSGTRGAPSSTCPRGGLAAINSLPTRPVPSACPNGR